MAIALGAGLQQLGGGNKIGACLGGIEFGKQFARLVFIARIATEREECVRRKGQEPIQRQTTGNVFDMRVESPVFMRHDNGR